MERGARQKGVAAWAARVGGRAIGFTLGIAISLGPAVAGQSCFRGINLSGAEFGNPGGVLNGDYTYPSEQTVRYFSDKGFTSIRLPFLWERLQPVLFQDFDPEEARHLDAALALFRQYRLSIVLDPHNYARYKGKVVGSEKVPNAAFADFWGRLAARYGDASDVTFGLMNEPYDIPARQWLGAANAAIAAIRERGAKNLVLVPGTAWTGAHSWEKDHYGEPNAVVMKEVADPGNNYAFEVHQYFDDDFSGTKGNCSRAQDAIDALRQFTRWLHDNDARGYLGEFGIPAKGDCVAALEGLTSVVEQNRDVWTGWAYWVAGDWWPPSEPLNIQPTAEGDRPQLDGLKPFLKDFSATGATCPALDRH